MGRVSEHRLEVLAQKYGFPPTLTPAEAVACRQAAGLTGTDDYRKLSGSVRDGPEGLPLLGLFDSQIDSQAGR